MAKPRTLTLDRFFSHVDEQGPLAKNHPELGRCHLWTARLSQWGYGAFEISWRPWPRVRTYAHVFAWEIANKCYKPKDRDLDHFACDNRACCNAQHVRPEARGKNVLRNESPPSKNSRKKECPAGHPYTAENTYRTKSGHRRCKACVDAANIRRYYKRKSQKT